MSDSNPLKSVSGRLKKVSNDTDLSNLVYGKVQPQAVPLEQAVLGAIMIDRDALPMVLDILQPDSFYKNSHTVIYRAMMDLFDKSQPIDILTVNDTLRKSGELEAAGGPQYLVELTNLVASAANIEYHARIISQKNIQRELIRVSTKIINDSFEETKDVFDMLDEAEKGLFDITQQHLNKGSQSIGVLAIKAQKMMEELSTKEAGLTGVPSGFTELDKLTSGWQPSDLIIIAARPGMGKTAFTLALAKNAAMDFDKPVAIFSLEMSNLQLVQRMISMEAEISSRQLRNAQLEDYQWQQVNSAVEKLSQAKIFIDDTPGINIFELRAKCRRLKMKEDIQMIVIDYLQLMSGGPESSKKGNREQEISSISRALKGLAKELSVPVIALSQLSRAVETRGGSKRPMLSDLRESGAIEQDADIVQFIYRPGYYGLDDEEGEAPPGLSEIIVAKHRNGALDTVNLRFIDRFAKFTDWEEIDFGNLGGGDPFNNPSQNPMNNIITRPSRMNEDDTEIPF